MIPEVHPAKPCTIDNGRFTAVRNPDNTWLVLDSGKGIGITRMMSKTQVKTMLQTLTCMTLINGAEK